MVVENGPGSSGGDVMCDDGEEDFRSDNGPSLIHDNDERNSSSNGDDDSNFDPKELLYETQVEDNSIIVETENGFMQSLQDLKMENESSSKKRKSIAESGDLLKAPDGGYGWVICCGVFMNHMIYGGLGRCEGLFFLQFQSKFGESAQLTAWPGSLMSTLNLFMGPVCGAVVSRYSVRTAFFIGTCLCFTGMLLNGLAPNIYFLFLSHTLLGGIGRGFMSGILLLNLYFDKHRSLATGLGSSGVGIGSLWVVPLTQFLFDEYDFSGAFLILSAVGFHGFLMAMLFRPLSMHYRFIKKKLQRREAEAGNTEEGTALTLNTKHSFRKQTSIAEENNSDMEVAEENNSDMEKLPSDQFFIDSENEKVSGKSTTDHDHLLQDTRNVDMINSNLVAVTKQPAKETAVSKGKGLEPLFFNSDMEKIVQTQSSKSDEDSCCKSSIKICFPIEFKQTGSKKKKKAFHWNLLKHVPFMIFCVSNFLFILAFKTAFTFLPAIAMSKGLSRQEAALVLTISGALDTFGRIATGFIMDFRILRPLRPYVFNLLLFIIAAASLLIPSLTTFASFSIVCSVYGFMTGAFIAQKMVVLVDILGREMMPSSLGIQKVFQGFGTLIGPPFAGALRDALGSYDSSFYLGGASMIGAGIILFLSTLLLRIRNRKASNT